jgi:hypothetical protein
MSDKEASPLGNVITIDDERIKSRPKRVVRVSVEEGVERLLAARSGTTAGSRNIAGASGPIIPLNASCVRSGSAPGWFGAFPDGQSALNLAIARSRHIAGTARSTKGYSNIELLKDWLMRDGITA